MWVCGSVCPLAYCKSHMSKLYECFCTMMLSVAVDPSSSYDSAIDVLPVLWMTSCAHNGPTTDKGLESATLRIIHVTRQVAPLNSAPVAKSAIVDCLVYAATSVSYECNKN